MSCDDRNIENTILPHLQSQQCKSVLKGKGLFAGPHASALKNQLLYIFEGKFSKTLSKKERSYTLQFNTESLPNVPEVRSMKDQFKFFVPKEPGRRLNSSVGSKDKPNAVLKLIYTEKKAIKVCLYAERAVQCNEEIIAAYHSEFPYGIG